MISSEVEHFVDIEGVIGSIPISSTNDLDSINKSWFSAKGGPASGGDPSIAHHDKSTGNGAFVFGSNCLN